MFSFHYCCGCYYYCLHIALLVSTIRGMGCCFFYYCTMLLFVTIVVILFILVSLTSWRFFSLLLHCTHFITLVVFIYFVLLPLSPIFLVCILFTCHWRESTWQPLKFAMIYCFFGCLLVFYIPLQFMASLHFYFPSPRSLKAAVRVCNDVLVILLFFHCCYSCLLTSYPRCSFGFLFLRILKEEAVRVRVVILFLLFIFSTFPHYSWHRCLLF